MSFFCSTSSANLENRCFIIHNCSDKITLSLPESCPFQRVSEARRARTRLLSRAPERDYHDIPYMESLPKAEAPSNFKNTRKQPFPTVTLTICKYYACMPSYPKFRLFLILLCQVQRQSHSKCNFRCQRSWYC